MDDDDDDDGGGGGGGGGCIGIGMRFIVSLGIWLILKNIIKDNLRLMGLFNQYWSLSEPE
jgi:hypothetical protein